MRKESKALFYGLFIYPFTIFYLSWLSRQEAFKKTNFTKRSNNFYAKLRGDKISEISNSIGNNKYCLR